MDCLCRSDFQTESHSSVYKGQFQHVVAALRTVYEEQDCLPGGPQRDRECTHKAAVKKRKFTFQANPFREQRRSKINKRV